MGRSSRLEIENALSALAASSASSDVRRLKPPLGAFGDTP
jgi:hypothetical protein